MGRMLETLKSALSQRSASAEMKPTPPADVGGCVVDWTLSDQPEAPYIEVGGPDKRIEASADVLAVQPPHQPPTQPPHVALADPKKTAAVHLTLAQPMGISFESWPGQSVPSRGVVPDIIALHQPEHPVSKQYAHLLEQMLQALPAATSSALLFTGVKPRVGVTTVALNLAVHGAVGHKRKVAVLDANLRRPAVAERLGFQTPAGILDVLTGAEALEHILLTGPVAGLHVLPGKAAQDMLLTPEAAGWLVGWLRERFDLVLIDGPTMEEAALLALWVPGAQAIYAVAPHQEAAGQKTLAHAITRLGGRLRGLIHTHLE